MRGSIRRRAAKSWTLRFDVGRHQDGRRKQQVLTVRGTRHEAEKKLSDQLSAISGDSYVDPSTRTVGAWLTDWLGLITPTVRAATLTRYRGIVENHIQKAPLAKMSIQRLRASHVEAYYATVPVGSRTLHHSVLSRALRKAVKDRLIVRNPLADLDRAPRRPKGRGDAVRVNCWTGSEARAFLESAKAAGPQPAALYALALDSGARKGELCGLRWSDVDLRGGTIRIVRQLVKPGPDPVYGLPKNGLSRDIAIASPTVELLREHKRRQAEIKTANRATYHDHGLVFAKEYGELTNRTDAIGLPLQSNHLGQRQFAKLVKAAMVRPITFHGMRHSCATLLLQAGVPVHVVSRRLGHARVEITLNTYTHVFPDDQSQAANALGALLFAEATAAVIKA